MTNFTSITTEDAPIMSLNSLTVKVGASVKLGTGLVEVGDCPDCLKRRDEGCTATTTSCDVSPCRNGANCTDLGEGNYTCECTAGYSGDWCQFNIDECASNPCRGGACTDGVGSFVCTCDPGFSGERCDQFTCSTPCGNHSTCVGPDTCSCDAGWGGEACDQRVLCGDVAVWNSS